jgi:hypothetical protein
MAGAWLVAAAMVLAADAGDKEAFAKTLPPPTKDSIWSEDADDWTVEPFVGNPSARTYIQGPAQEAGFVDRMNGMVFGDDGDVFVSEGSYIGRVDRDGNYRQLAGVPGYAGFRDGPAERALFASIWMVKGAPGQIYILDRGNYCVRELRKVDGKWMVSTVAGTPEKSDRNHTDGPALQAGFGDPCNLAINSKGELYTFDNNIIRKIAGGKVETVKVKPGIKFNLIMGAQCCFDDKDNLFVADRWNFAVRKVDVATGEVTDVVGTAGKGRPSKDGPAIECGFYDSPGYVMFDPLRQCLYTNGVDEPYIRRLKDGVVKTVIGGRVSKWLYGPGKGVDIGGGTFLAALDKRGDMYILKRDFCGIRKARYIGKDLPAGAEEKGGAK